MRTRNMKMQDYNISAEDYRKLLEYCKKMGMEDRLCLFKSAISAAPGLEVPIYDSLVSGIGYRTIVRMGRDIPAKEDDFYAYRRKTLAVFYDRLRMYGRWKS